MVRFGSPEHLAMLKAQDKRPELPTLKSPMGANGLAGAYKSQGGPQLQAQTIDPSKYAADTAALDKLKEYAMSDGASPWLKMQLEAQGINQLSAMDQAGGQAQSAAAMARSQLASRGGLSGGAAERLAQGAGNGLMQARQGIARAGELERLGLNVSDQQTKMQTLSQIPGMDLGFANQLSNMAQFNAGQLQSANQFNSGQQQQNQQFNVGNTLSALDRENQNRLGIYKEQMAGYGAEKTAQATRKGGKK